MENNQEKKGVVGKVIEGLKESTRNVHEINKQNFKEVRADSKANFQEATKPNPEFQEFKETKGLKNKAKVVVKHIKEGAKANSIKESARRQEIQSHKGYQETLKAQRAVRQDAISKDKE